MRTPKKGVPHHDRENKKTAEEIQEEIQKLKDMKLKVRKFSSFGDNNHLAIEASIKVLEENMSEDQIWDYWSSEDESSEFNSAIDTRRWMDGEEETSSSEGFAPLVIG